MLNDIVDKDIAAKNTNLGLAKFGPHTPRERIPLSKDTLTLLQNLITQNSIQSPGLAEKMQVLIIRQSDTVRAFQRVPIFGGLWGFVEKGFKRFLELQKS